MVSPLGFTKFQSLQNQISQTGTGGLQQVAFNGLWTFLFQRLWVQATMLYTVQYIIISLVLICRILLPNNMAFYFNPPPPTHPPFFWGGGGGLYASKFMWQNYHLKDLHSFKFHAAYYQINLQTARATAKLTWHGLCYNYIYKLKKPVSASTTPLLTLHQYRHAV